MILMIMYTIIIMAFIGASEAGEVDVLEGERLGAFDSIDR